MPRPDPQGDEIERIARVGFKAAKSRVTSVDKANVLDTSRLWREVVTRIHADEFPNIELEHILVDAAAMKLVLDPHQFDVLVMENLFGDVMSDACAGLVGGLGVVPGANIGLRYALFEAVHGSAPDIAGKGVANPIALLRSGAMMLDHIGQRVAAQRIEQSVRNTLQAGVGLTRDLGGTGDTRSITEQLIANL